MNYQARLDPTVLGATALVMVLLWLAYRRWQDRAIQVFVANCALLIGASGLYFYMTNIFDGRIECFGARCRATYFRELHPREFWLSATLTLAMFASFVGAGAFVLYRTLSSGKGDARDDTRRDRPPSEERAVGGGDTMRGLGDHGDARCEPIDGPRPA